jgi:hypothetical protein
LALRPGVVRKRTIARYSIWRFFFRAYTRKWRGPVTDESWCCLNLRKTEGHTWFPSENNDLQWMKGGRMWKR